MTVVSGEAAGAARDSKVPEVDLGGLGVLQYVIAGLVLGGIYAIAAAGLVVMWPAPPPERRLFRECSDSVVGKGPVLVAVPDAREVEAGRVVEADRKHRPVVG